MHNCLKKGSVCIYQSHQLHNCHKKCRKCKSPEVLGVAQILPNAQLSQKRQRLHIPISPIAQLSQKKQKMQISRGLGTTPQPPTQDLWRAAFFVFFETVVQLVRLVYANSAFFETLVTCAFGNISICH